MVSYCVYLMSVYSWQVSTYFCVCKWLLFQLFCLKGCLLCRQQFHTSHLNIKGSIYCFDCKKNILIIFHVIFGAPLHFLISQNSSAMFTYMLTLWFEVFLTRLYIYIYIYIYIIWYSPLKDFKKQLQKVGLSGI